MTALEFDPVRLDAYLRRSIDGLEGTMQIERIAGGQSNPTFFVTYANRRMVLRKKPAGETLPSAHAVDREARILTALAGGPVPVPRVLLFEAEPDVVGTPFYVMERVEGRVFGDSVLSQAAPAQRRDMYRSFATTLAALHDVDYVAAGLEGFGKPGGYFERQMARWTKQWEAQRFRDIPDLARLQQRLIDELPPDDGVSSICHGDFRIGNMIFDPKTSDVAAVLDWELSTIGHPMADLGFSVICWRSSPEEYVGLLGLDLPSLGIPSEAEYLEWYYEARRTPVPALQPFHVAFAMFRFAVIFEGIAARARAGTAASENAATVGDLSMVFARRGLEALAGEHAKPAR